jgi:hypothetical protein
MDLDKIGITVYLVRLEQIENLVHNIVSVSLSLAEEIKNILGRREN